MAENKKSFLLYCDLIHTIEKMPKEKAGELFLHILQYVNDKNPITDDLIINLTFEPIKQSLKRDLLKYEKIRERNIENIGKRWDKNNTKNTTGKNGIPKIQSNTVSDSVNDSVSVNDIEKEKEIFNNLQFEILNAELWIKDSCRILKIQEVQFKMLLRQFTDELWLKKDFYKEVHEAQSHFINWVKKEISKNKTDTAKVILTSTYPKLNQ